MSRYVEAWNYERFGMPHELVAIHAVFNTRLTVPSGQPRLVRAQATGSTSLFRNDEPLVAPLEPGEHALKVEWQSPADQPTHLFLEWQTAPGRWERIPRRALLLPKPPPFYVIATLALLVLCVAVGASFALYRVLLLPSPRRRRSLFRASVVLIFILGATLRLFDYATAPSFTASSDELFATWNGWSLLNGEGTRGWSLWPDQYGERVEIEPCYHFRPGPLYVITPYFEHPPGMHLLVGAVAAATGIKHWSHARLTHTRLVPFALSVLSMLLVFLIARRLSPRSIDAALALLLYATIPTIVLQSRLIKEEALLTPIALATVWCFLRYRDQGRDIRFLVMSALLAGSAVWVKLPGAIYIVILALLVFSVSGLRAAMIALAIGSAVASTLLIYAAALDWDLFWFSTTIQATFRHAHFNNFMRFFDAPQIASNAVGRGWMLFLWIAFLLAPKSRKSGLVLALPLVLYLAGIAVSSGNWTFGWYWLPLYPFLCIGAGRFVAHLLRQPRLLASFILVVTAAFYTVNFMVPYEFVVANVNTMRQSLALLTALFLAPPVLYELWSSRITRTAAQISIASAVALLTVGSTYFVVTYDDIEKRYENLDLNRYYSP